jgi:hypothetical protein
VGQGGNKQDAIFSNAMKSDIVGFIEKVDETPHTCQGVPFPPEGRCKMQTLNPESSTVRCYTTLAIPAKHHS